MFLSVQNINKSFGATEILRGCSFDLPKGKTMSILGKSGCGKTTLLKIIAGLIENFEGTIILDHENLGGKSPQKRNTVYLYQEPLLFPHLNVFENVAFGLKLKDKSKFKSITNLKVNDFIKQKTYLIRSQAVTDSWWF